MVIKTQNCSLFITGINGCFFNFGHFMSKGLLFIKVNKLVPPPPFLFVSFKTGFFGGFIMILQVLVLAKHALFEM